MACQDSVSTIACCFVCQPLIAQLLMDALNPIGVSSYYDIAQQWCTNCPFRSGYQYPILQKLKIPKSGLKISTHMFQTNLEIFITNINQINLMQLLQKIKYHLSCNFFHRHNLHPICRNCKLQKKFRSSPYASIIYSEFLN